MGVIPTDRVVIHLPSHPEESGREYPNHPRIGVGVLVIRNEQFLLIKRGQAPSKGMWTFPGGLVELGESLEQAAQREVLEECGLHIDIERYLDTYEFIQRDEQKRIKYHYIVIDFLARYVDGALRVQDDIVDAKWLTKTEIDNLELTDGTRTVLKKAGLID